MDTYHFKVTVGTPNILPNRNDLEKRGRIVGMSNAQIEELTDCELARLVLLKELKDY